MSSGLKVNDSSERVIKLYTGLENFRVVAVNPNKAQLKELFGIDVDKEPEYVGKNNEGLKQVRISFWLDNADEVTPIRTRADYYVVLDHKVSTGGKPKFVNKFGQFAYLPADGSIPDNMSWFNNTDLRKALQGEEELTDFVKNYINHSTKNGESAQLNVDDYLKGDFSQLVGILSNNKLKGCLGIKQYTDKDGNIKYQQVLYTRKTDRSWGDGTKIRKDIEEYKANGGAKNIYYGEGSLKLTVVDDPSSLEIFSADDPSKLVGTATAKKPAF